MWKHRPPSRSDSQSGTTDSGERGIGFFGWSKKKSPPCVLSALFPRLPLPFRLLLYTPRGLGHRRTIQPTSNWDCMHNNHTVILPAALPLASTAFWLFFCPPSLLTCIAA
ncbi:hypothetical protein BDV12DRAFT_27481 [Aspergillus spectabilis]